MKKPALLILLFFSVGFLYARGKAEEKKAAINNEWTLCITAFDVSALPPSRRIIGDILARDLVNVLKSVDRRYRSNEEVSFYENYAMARARAAAAKALSTKRNERDQLLYQGEPSKWKYRKNLNAKDLEIIKLEEALKKIEAEPERPVVNPEPLFRFVDANKNDSWPAAPSHRGERRFCITQKADAFITGVLSEFYGRTYLHLKMYTLHTKSYSYEDTLIFSSEDIQEALDELSVRVFAAISGARPAGLAIHVQPDDAIVLVDGSYVDSGEAAPKEYAPGIKEIEAYSDRYISTRFQAELNAGELADVYINLTPLSIETLTVDVPGQPDSSVYLGGLFVGKAPLTIELLNQNAAYITVETQEGETGSAIISGGSVIRGNAQFSRAAENTLFYKTSMPVDPNEKRINKAKLKFYGAYGRFWIALPVSMVVSGMAENHINSFYSDKASYANYINIGAYTVLGLAGADLVYRLVRYLYISRSDADPIARFPKTPDPKPGLKTGEN
ncbi:MAG: hypothetical protein LBH43_00230 [Treponema sp.]|nr:hypothetical protein [Treponema sp.]